MVEKDEDNLMEKIVSLAKRRGFIFPGSEIYGGLAGTWDYGPLGLSLKNNIKNLWWRMFVAGREDMYGIDTAVLMNEKVWVASGHTGAGFTDPVVECANGHRFRADHLGDANACPECGAPLGAPRAFNLMFETKVGAEGTARSYLRPETAQGMFVNFKNIVDAYHPKLPFGIAQVGRAFRNEIAPRDFIFRVREFEIMEFEYFIREKEWEEQFEYWVGEMRRWFAALGFAAADLREQELPPENRAHYSKRTIDFHFRYPHKFDEIAGIAYRTDFDLSRHREHSGVELAYLDEETKERIIPHVIEPTFGLDRHVLAVVAKAYAEDELGGERRVYLALPAHLAPVKAAVFPLLKNKPALVTKARDVYAALKQEVPEVMFDDNGNIGKRYRRQDEIGTPLCVTIDFDTLEDDSVTLRDRDSGSQERLHWKEAVAAVARAATLPVRE